MSFAIPGVGLVSHAAARRLEPTPGRGHRLGDPPLWTLQRLLLTIAYPPIHLEEGLPVISASPIAS